MKKISEAWSFVDFWWWLCHLPRNVRKTHDRWVGGRQWKRLLKNPVISCEFCGRMIPIIRSRHFVAGRRWWWVCSSCDASPVLRELVAGEDPGPKKPLV